MTMLQNWSDEELLQFIQQGGQRGPSALEEIGPSAKAGAVKAASGIAGLPGDIQSLTAMGAEAITGRPVQQNPDLRFPTSGAVQGKIEEWTGPLYEPKTATGKLTRTAVEMLPAALMPAGAGAGVLRSLPQRAMNVIGPTLGAESGEAVAGKPGRVAGALLGGVAGARGITPAAATPEHAAMVRVLEKEGVPLTAGQRTGSLPMRWFEEAAADTPFAGTRAAKMNEAQKRAFSGAVMRKVGASGNEVATTGAVDTTVRNLSNRFEAISARNTLQADQQFGNDLLSTAQKYVDSVIPSQRASGRQNIHGIMQDVVDEIQRNGGAMSGELYQATRSRLGSMADGVKQSDPQLSEAIRGIRNALDEAMNRSISPADRAEWAQLRKQWKNWKAIESGMGTGSDVAKGFISPSQLATSVRNQDRSGYLRGRGDMNELAHAGEAVLKPLPNSGTPARAQAGGAMSIAGMLLGHAGSGGDVMATMAGAGIGPTIGRALLSTPVQKYLGNQLLPNTPAEIRRALIAEQLLARPRIQEQAQ